MAEAEEPSASTEPAAAVADPPETAAAPAEPPQPQAPASEPAGATADSAPVGGADIASPSPAAPAASQPAVTDSHEPEPHPVPAEAASAEHADADKHANVLRVALRHPFFAKLEGAYFRPDPATEEAMLMVTFGKNEVALPFPGVRRELALAPDDPDNAMLGLIERSLRYVKALNFGDPIPTEVLDRTASWPLPAEAAVIAYQKVTVQLMNWMTGGTTNIGDPDELARLAQDKEVRGKINAAFAEAAEQLGLGRDQRDEVVKLVETLAHELGYIEALRLRFQRILRLGVRLRDLHGELARSHRNADLSLQVFRLYRRGVTELHKLFVTCDARTGSIMDVLRELEKTIAYIRDRRDDLYVRLLIWDEIVDGWEKIKVGDASGQSLRMLRRTYELLAPRYMHVDAWVLVIKNDIFKRTGKKPAESKAMTKAEAEAEDAERFARAMIW